MMNKHLLGSLVALLGWTGLAHAQAGLGAPVAGIEAPSAQVHHSTDCRFDCKPRYPILGNLARTMMTPRTSASQPMTPTPVSDIPTRDELSRMILDGSYSPAEITAAKIKIDESQGSARRAAVKYLATIDCHYYPEVEASLIAALRADRVEMVRYEAALAMGTCRGLTERMLEALNLTALGLDLDGNPAESSYRVRGVARASLKSNLARGLCLPPVSDPATAGLEWMTSDSNAVKQMGHVTPLYLPIAPPVSQHERELAETVSTQAKPAAGSRTFLQNLFSFSFLARSPATTGDPRLRGLAPIGSEWSLAIPTRHPNPSTFPAVPSYNYQQ